MRLLLIAAQTITRRPLRSVLTALSLILGVLALTSVAAAQDVIGQTITRTALLTGGPISTSAVSITDPVDKLTAATRWAGSLRTRYGSATVTARTLQASVVSLSTFTGTGSEAPVADVQIEAVDPDLIRIRPFQVISGAWLDPRTQSLAPQVVLNAAAAADTAPGSSWRLRWGATGDSRAAQVVGVVDDGSTSPTAYLDLTQRGPWLQAAVAQGGVDVIIHAPEVTTNDVTTGVRQTAQVAGTSLQVGDVRRTDTLSDLSDELSTSARVFLAVAAVSLIVAAVGLLNIGLSTLAERADELSLRRAFGAHRGGVFTLMLLEAQLVAIIAGAIAIALAWMTLPLTLDTFGATSTTPPDFPTVAALIGLSAGILAATIGALVPALRAVHTPIASIMRG